MKIEKCNVRAFGSDGSQVSLIIPVPDISGEPILMVTSEIYTNETILKEAESRAIDELKRRGL